MTSEGKVLNTEVVRVKVHNIAFGGVFIRVSMQLTELRQELGGFLSPAIIVREDEDGPGKSLRQARMEK